jgi:hypothetical protein
MMAELKVSALSVDGVVVTQPELERRAYATHILLASLIEVSGVGEGVTTIRNSEASDPYHPKPF